MKHVTVIGGGTGSFVLLSGLKDKPIDLGAIVTMMDSGGSTGRLRDQLGVLPPGDLRQCLVALSDAPELWRKLMLYRFEDGDLKGHNVGNILLSALEKVSDNYDQVLEAAEQILNTRGTVYPVTYEKTQLCVEYENGTTIRGEGNIDEDNPEESRIVRAFVDPEVSVNKKAVERIHESDVLVVGPGDLYTSIIPVLVVDHIKKHIQERNPIVIYTMNLMTKMGQTTHYTAADHYRDLTRYLGKTPEYIIINSQPIPDDIRKWYNSHNEHSVEDNLDEIAYPGTVVRAELLDTGDISRSASDTLTRSIIRHDSQKLAQHIYSIISNEK
jgi:uncharacterized cofD-like protein